MLCFSTGDSLLLNPSNPEIFSLLMQEFGRGERKQITLPEKQIQSYPVNSLSMPKETFRLP